ncbi:MAG: hypothetical protein ACJA2M_001333 [Polaribacter sp.]|jgi:hypothetical protein
MKNLEKQAMAIVAQLFDLAEVPVDKRQEINDVAYDYVTEQLIITDVGVMLPLLEVDRETLTILKEYYKDGEKLEAIKMLIAEVKRTYYHFGIKEAKTFFEGN